MTTQRRALIALFWLLAGLVVSANAHVDPNLYSAMKWRLIGPFRGGRITSVSGVAGSGSTYYAGTPAGGLWKTIDAGNSWVPVFDKQRVSSIGAVAVSPCDAKTVYVGTGEQNRGDGVYRSTDAGETWTNIGLKESHVITSLLVDPKNCNTVLVGVAGDRTSATERGIYRTTDGGKIWKKVWFRDNETAIRDMSFDINTPKVVYATALKNPPLGQGGAGRAQPSKEQNATLLRSSDGGETWNVVDGKGLPNEAMGRTGVAVAPNTHGNTVYVIATQGLFRSDDGGANFTHSTTDPRVVGNGYICHVYVDPMNANKVYVAQTAMYGSKDGGKTFTGFYGAPSGDDIQVMWMDPLNSRNMILGVDQGAIVSMNGGETFSSWYNQPTGQFYHVSTDSNFPYYVYGAQQDSGTAAVASRTDYGLITYRDWAPTGGFEFAFIAPDPANPDVVYTGGWYGSVLRYNKSTGQTTHIFARTAKYRTANMAPVVFSPQDAHTLYIGAQYVLRTKDGGNSWQEVSGDLTVKPNATPPPPEPGRQPGANITSLALSAAKEGVMWAGTSNGLVQVSRDGSTWQNVTPTGLPERAMVNAIEASRHDATEAFVIINVNQDSHPYIFRTRDYGQSWQAITSGMPDDVIARIVREDPVRKGLLFAGTENASYVSFDEGDHWQSLQLNLPVTSVRDFEIHGNDLVAATYGRALWILDDITTLRQLDAKFTQAEAALFKPQDAIRAHWDENQDTPLQAETPAGANPPEGAIIDYYLKSAPEGEVKLAIWQDNQMIQEFSSVAAKHEDAPPNVPDYWFAPPTALTKDAGHNRFAWDLRFPAPRTLRYGYYGNLLDYVEYTLAEHAIPGDTPREQPLGPMAVPGKYFVVLTVNGQSYRQPLTIVPDPRVKVPQADLVAQHTTLREISGAMSATYDGFLQLAQLHTAIADRVKTLSPNIQAKDAVDAMQALDKQVTAVSAGSPDELGMGPINREMARLVSMLSGGDARPPQQLQQAVEMSCDQLGKRITQWREINANAIPQVNQLLQKYNLAALPSAALDGEGCVTFVIHK